MKLTLSLAIKRNMIDSKKHFSMQSFDKFVNYFFDDLDLKIEDSLSNDSDGIIYDVRDNIDAPNKKLNVILSVENCPYWNIYNHYTKYGDFGDRKVTIYLYNHIDRIHKNKTEKYIAIPIIYLQINYFKKFYNDIKPTSSLTFKKKKFCLIATRVRNTSEFQVKDFEFKEKIINKLTSINQCDFLENFKELLGNKSCYHDINLLNLFHQYKFVFVSENSLCDGYITEKIFNCYFARTIPIYYGSRKINYYFNDNTFINIVDFNNFEDKIEEIKKIENSKALFNSYLCSKIINDSYDDQNYKKVFKTFIKKHIL